MSEDRKFYTWDEVQEMYPRTQEALAESALEKAVYTAIHNLRQVRKRRMVTQTALADLLKVSQNRISQIERGNLVTAQVGTLERYIEALGGELTVSAKFGDETFVLAQSK